MNNDNKKSFIEVKKALVLDTSELATKEELNSKADEKELQKKQDKLIYSGDNQNIALINGQSLEGKKDIRIGGNPFTEVELARIKALLKNHAFGINKVTSELEQKGMFTQQTFYSDLDKPEDNMVTDRIGNDLGIRKIADHHYSGNTWRDADGNTTLRDYKGVLEYKNDKIAFQKDVIFPWIEGEYKYVPIGTIMPDGWVKITKKNNATLLANPLTSDTYYAFANNESSGRAVLKVDANLSDGTNRFNFLSEEGKVNTINYISSELWQYDPHGKYQKERDKRDTQTQPLEKNNSPLLDLLNY